MDKKQEEYLGIIENLRPVLVETKALNWCDPRHLASVCDTVTAKWQADYHLLNTTLPGILDVNLSVTESTQATHDFLAEISFGQAPSLTACVAYVADFIGLNLTPDLQQSLILAALLGDVENTVPYHNNGHYLKVLLQTVRLAVAHNTLFTGTDQALNNENGLLLMIAACIHDLGHDGTGNMFRGVFKQSRLELQSIDIIQPYLTASGLDEKHMDALRVMILSTDVTPVNDAANPMNQMKAAYRFHFRGDKDKVDSLHLDASMRPLQKDEKLTLMSLILHEADIATSAGITYEVTQYETILYRDEICEDEAKPIHVVDFIDNICRRTFLTDAGQRLFGANLARIYAQASEAAKNGNEAFGTIQNNSLLASMAAESEDTVN